VTDFRETDAAFFCGRTPFFAIYIDHDALFYYNKAKSAKTDCSKTGGNNL
jgi:hypothetical protein